MKAVVATEAPGTARTFGDKALEIIRGPSRSTVYRMRKNLVYATFSDLLMPWARRPDQADGLGTIPIPGTRGCGPRAVWVRMVDT